MYDTMMFDVWYSHVWCTLHHAPDPSGCGGFARCLEAAGLVELAAAQDRYWTPLYRTQDITVSYTRHHGIVHQTSHQTSRFIARHNVRCSRSGTCARQPSLTHRHRCIIHQISVYHTPASHKTALYKTPDITVSYTRYRYIIHWTSLYHTQNTTPSYTRYSITVSCTRHHCIIHTLDITVSYTRHHCIIH